MVGLLVRSTDMHPTIGCDEFLQIVSVRSQHVAALYLSLIYVQ